MLTGNLVRVRFAKNKLVPQYLDPANRGWLGLAEQLLVAFRAAPGHTRGGREIRLTPREYSLLEALAANEGRVLTREMIQDGVWRDDESYSNTVDVHISALRKKIDVDQDVKLIQTVHGRGYMLKGPDSEAIE